MTDDQLISKERAQVIAQASIGDDWVISGSEDVSLGWVFHYGMRGTDGLIDHQIQLAGNTPLLVERQCGRLIVLGTGYPLEWYLDNYQATGDPHTPPGRTVEIFDWVRGAQSVSAIKAVRASADLGLSEARLLIEKSLAGAPVLIVTRDSLTAAQLVAAMDAVGFRARRVADA